MQYPHCEAMKSQSRPPSALVGALILMLDGSGLLETSSLRACNLPFTGTTHGGIVDKRFPHARPLIVFYPFETGIASAGTLGVVSRDP
jgi:hypothetical protein